MFVKSIAAGLAAGALLVTVASAQTPMKNSGSDTITTMAPVSEKSLQGDWRTSKIIGLSVYNGNNASIGSINELLMDKSGNIKAVVIGVGGLLGVGEHLVAVPFEKVKFVDQPVAYTASNASSDKPASDKPASTTTTGTATTKAGSTASTSSKSNPWYPNHAVLNASKDELQAMPEFKYSS